MRKAIVAMSLLVPLAGCAAPQTKTQPGHPASLYSDRADDDDRYAGNAGSPHAGQWAVAIIGTPVYLAMKTVVCGASLVVAAPTAAVIALTDSPYAMGVDRLGDGLAANCGPPYVLSPS